MFDSCNTFTGIAVFDFSISFLEEFLNIGIYGVDNKRIGIDCAITVDDLCKFGDLDKSKKSRYASYIKLNEGVFQKFIPYSKQPFNTYDIDYYFKMLNESINEKKLKRLYKQKNEFYHKRK